ncbi:MAG: 4-(cytidine 5'-diphospho)-2-C-methyl-D-erythritol kinase [Deltaproteobacteria bacterium]|nr:4-(cytidine 5'-diphospho)-2-C-methyl-D-erythritol kinase [Deltaproteobacteria bacterium]
MSSNSASFIYFAPAKVNIRLKVIGRRSDGYHELVSVMAPVGLYDRLEFQTTSGRNIAISCRGFRAPSDETNIACRAAKAFFARTGIDRGVSIQLIKNIPVAAGLGGGSSDAACVLKALNRTYGFPLTEIQLAELALGLGADVPFFLAERPCIARGIGEVLEPIENWPSLWYLIITPSISVSTAWVYGRLKASAWSGELELTNEAYQITITHLKRMPFAIGPLMENDLEQITAKRFPEIEHIKKGLGEAGAEGALMSGSGPSVFGIFRSKESGLWAKKILAASDPGDIFLAQGLG